MANLFNFSVQCSGVRDRCSTTPRWFSQDKTSDRGVTEEREEQKEERGEKFIKHTRDTKCTSMYM